LTLAPGESAEPAGAAVSFSLLPLIVCFPEF
jgi:hypothetical protein